MSKSVLVIGLGRFGRYLTKELENLEHEVLAVDKDEDRVNAAMKLTQNVMIGDCSNEDFLKSLGVNNFDVCYVAIGDNFLASLETTSLLKELGAKLVVARASRETQKKFLLRNGADEVVFPEEQLATWSAIRYTADHVFDYIEVDGDYSIFEVEVPEEWVGKAIIELDVRKKMNLNILGVRKDGVMNMKITPEMVLGKGESLFVLGLYEDLRKCFKL